MHDFDTLPTIPVFAGVIFFLYSMVMCVVKRRWKGIACWVGLFLGASVTSHAAEKGHLDWIAAHLHPVFFVILAYVALGVAMVTVTYAVFIPFMDDE